MAFTPILLFSSIGVVIFFAGILNVMSYAVYFIIFGGIACWWKVRPWRCDAFFIERYDVICILVFGASCLLFAIRLYKQIPLHYDCFSHWLTVVREMLLTDSMPNFESKLILFQGYPTGAAGFIYFICKFLGRSRDDLVLFAQSILLAACLCVFLAYVRKSIICGGIITIVGAVYCLVANIMITDILVDTLISLLSLAVVALLVYYRNNLFKATLLSIPIQMFLISVKNSGIIMVVMNVAVLLILLVVQSIQGRKFNINEYVKLLLIHVGPSVMTFVLWEKHVECVLNFEV